jgi:hypothetical protein
MFSLNPRVISIFAGAYTTGVVIGVSIGSVIQARREAKKTEAHFQIILDKMNSDIAQGEKDFEAMIDKQKEV